MSRQRKTKAVKSSGTEVYESETDLKQIMELTRKIKLAKTEQERLLMQRNNDKERVSSGKFKETVTKLRGQKMKNENLLGFIEATRDQFSTLEAYQKRLETEVKTLNERFLEMSLSNMELANQIRNLKEEKQSIQILRDENEKLNGIVEKFSKSGGKGRSVNRGFTRGINRDDRSKQRYKQVPIGSNDIKIMPKNTHNTLEESSGRNKIEYGGDKTNRVEKKKTRVQRRNIKMTNVHESVENKETGILDELKVNVSKGREARKLRQGQKENNNETRNPRQDDKSKVKEEIGKLEELKNNKNTTRDFGQLKQGQNKNINNEKRNPRQDGKSVMNKETGKSEELKINKINLGHTGKLRQDQKENINIETRNPRQDKRLENRERVKSYKPFSDFRDENAPTNTTQKVATQQNKGNKPNVVEMRRIENEGVKYESKEVAAEVKSNHRQRNDTSKRSKYTSESKISNQRDFIVNKSTTKMAATIANGTRYEKVPFKPTEKQTANLMPTVTVKRTGQTVKERVKNRDLEANPSQSENKANFEQRRRKEQGGSENKQNPKAGGVSSKINAVDRKKYNTNRESGKT